MKLKFAFAISLLVFLAGFSIASFSFAQTGAPPWSDGLCHYSDGSVGNPDVYGQCQLGSVSQPVVTPTPGPVTTPPVTTPPATNTPTTRPPTPAQSPGSTLPTCNYSSPNGLCLPPNPVCTSGNSSSIACSGNVNL